VRRALLVMLALSASSCGLLLDGAYLLSGKTMTKDVEQRRPTGEVQRAPERRIEVLSGHTHVACEDVTRGVDRVWSVHKTYEYRGGWYQVHWLPIILEGIIGAGLGIGFGVKCGDPTSGVSCTALYATIPFAVDVAYSIVRLLMIDPPKLVDKSLTEPHTDLHPTPNERLTTACEPDTEVIATASVSGGPLRVRVDASGWLAPQDEQQLRAFLVGYRDAQVSVWANGRQLSPEVSRCAFFRLGGGVPADCESSAR
jgi:hypothetical protein